MARCQACILIHLSACVSFNKGRNRTREIRIMHIEFEWDPDKATKNVKKHQVSFTEAATMFSDPLSMTFFDPDHSIDENRYFTVGLSHLGKLLMLCMRTEEIAYASLVREKQRSEREGFMKNKAEMEIDDELWAEYDLSQLKGGVRGKYVQRYKAGTNLVLLAPDVAEAFPSDEAVNEAL